MKLDLHRYWESELRSSVLKMFSVVVSASLYALKENFSRCVAKYLAWSLTKGSLIDCNHMEKRISADQDDIIKQSSYCTLISF